MSNSTAEPNKNSTTEATEEMKGSPPASAWAVAWWVRSLRESGNFHRLGACKRHRVPSMPREVRRQGMDDIVVLAPTRWKLRGAVKAVNQTMGALRLAKHPGKIFIGRIEKGFDFLGYHFSPQGLTPARQTIENFLERAIRLYEQEPGEEMAPVRLGAYVRRWEGWARGGLGKEGFKWLSDCLFQRPMHYLGLQCIHKCFTSSAL